MAGFCFLSSDKPTNMLDMAPSLLIRLCATGSMRNAKSGAMPTLMRPAK